MLCQEMVQFIMNLSDRIDFLYICCEQQLCALQIPKHFKFLNDGYPASMAVKKKTGSILCDITILDRRWHEVYLMGHTVACCFI